MSGVKLATAYYELIPSMAGNQSAIAAQMGAAGAASSKSFSSKFSSGTLSSLKAIGIAGAAAAAVGFIKGSIGEAREAQKVGALTAQVIKTTGSAANVTAKSVGNLAGAISKKTGIDDEAIQSGANMLLTFTNVRNEAGKGNDIFNRATQTITDMSAALGQDSKSSALQLGKALNDPIKGVTALSRVGVTFTKAQKDQIAAMVKAGDTAGAQKIILAELGKEFGGAAQAQATAGDKMSVAWGNLQESIGAKLLPVLDKLQAGLAAVFNFISAHQSVMVAIGLVVGVVLVAALVAATVAVWGFTIALLANPIVWIIIAIIALVAGIVMLITHWDLVKAKTLAVWGAIKGWLLGVWSSIKSKAAEAWDAIKDKLSEVWDTVRDTITEKGAAVLQWFKDLPGKIADAFTGAKTWLLNVGEDIINGLIAGIGNGFQWVKQKIEELGGNLVGWAKTILHIGSPSKVMAKEVGRWIPAGIALGIDQNSSVVRQSMTSLTADLARQSDVSVAGAAAGSARAADRPILMSDGTLFGWVRESARAEAELVLNTAVFGATMGARA